MGWKAYVRIIAATRDGITPWQAGERFGVGRQSIHEVMWRMESLGLIHVREWVAPRQKRGQMSAVFAFGAGQSAPYPRPMKRAGANYKTKKAPELIQLALILRLMSEGITRVDLMNETGSSWCRLSLLIKELRALGLSHISGWERRDHGSPSQIHKYGAGTDAPRPPKKPTREVERDYRRRVQLKRAAARVNAAIAGAGEIPRFGIQTYAFA